MSKKDIIRGRKDKLQSGGKCLEITYPTEDFPLEGIQNTQYQRYSIFQPPNKKRTKTQKGMGIQMANKYTIDIPHHQTLEKYKLNLQGDTIIDLEDDLKKRQDKAKC